MPERAAIFAMRIALSGAIGQFHTILQHLEADPPEPISTGMLRAVLRECERASLTYASLAEVLDREREAGRNELRGPLAGTQAERNRADARRGVAEAEVERLRAALSAQRAGEGEGRGLVVQWAVPSEVQVGEKVLDTSLNEFRRVTGIRPYKLGHEIAYEGDEQEWRLVDQRTLLVVVSNLETCGPPSTCSEPPSTGIAARVSGLRPGAAEPSPEEVERLTRDRDDAIRSRDTHKAWNHTAERERDAANVKVERLREALETIGGMTDSMCDHLSRSEALARLGDVYDHARAAFDAARIKGEQ